jgi:peptide/nickel transport system ATP-binding protein
MNSDDYVFEAKGLTKHFPAGRKTFIDSITRAKLPVVRAVDGVDLTIAKGETVALVGESGSGKTTLGRLLVTLETPTAGELYFMGKKVEGRSMFRELRRNVQMVFQNPLDSLDPRMSIKSIVTEPLVHRGLTKSARESMFSTALSYVGLDAETFAYRRPRDLSGGQRQRVAVARAIVPDPKFIVLDEPTSALDASVQGQVLNLLAKLHEELGFTYLLITHNISVARYIADRVAVMYAGKIVEFGPAEDVLGNPKHPYTQALFKSVPSLETKEIIPPVGEVPSLVRLPTGCRFHPRCPYVMDVCKVKEPGLIRSDKQDVACWLYEK